MAKVQKRGDDGLTEKQRRLLSHFVHVTGSIRLSAQSQHLHPGRHQQWLSTCPAYKAAYRRAKREAMEILEVEARRRAVLGTNEPVIFQGRLCGVWKKDGETVTEDTEGAVLVPLTVKKYSDPLLMFLMKGCLPGKYRDKAIEHKGRINHAHAHLHAQIRDQPDLSQLPPELLDQVIAALEAKRLPVPPEGGNA